MLQQIRKLFDQLGQCEEVEAGGETDVRMTSAALLAEVATVDHHLDQRERNALKNILQQHYQLDGDTAEQLVTRALAQREQATSLYQFTQAVNEAFDEREKYLLVRQMWQVAMADGVVEAFEEHLIRRVADLIYLPHGLFTRARAEARGMD